MTIKEKTAYLKGVLEGMDLDKKKNETKLFSLIAEVLEEMALSIGELELQTDAINDELDILEEAIEEIDSDLEQIDDDLDDICEIIGETYDADELDYDENDWDEELFEMTCPTCNEEIVIDEDILAIGEINCPACGEELEFDLSSLDEGCGCGCEDGNCEDTGCDCAKGDAE